MTGDDVVVNAPGAPTTPADAFLQGRLLRHWPIRARPTIAASRLWSQGLADLVDANERYETTERDEDPFRQEAKEAKRGLQRALRSRARHWLVDPSDERRLRDTFIREDWEHYCVPSVATFLARPSMLAL
eukprot:2863887-Pyramimonas_sp.AAC.1